MITREDLIIKILAALVANPQCMFTFAPYFDQSEARDLVKTAVKLAEAYLAFVPRT